MLRIDVHCHVGLRARPCQPERRFSFEPAGRYAPQDAYFSPRLARGVAMHIGRRFYGVSRSQGERDDDAAMERMLLNQILGATLIDRAVVLAFDQYHTNDGRPLGLRLTRADPGTDLYVSNTYVRELARRYPQRILFGASMHPYRRAEGVTPPGSPLSRGGTTAVEMLAEVAAAGAVLVKWLPITQNIDARDPRTVAFMRRAAELQVPLLIHFGGELSLGRPHPEFQGPAPLLETLRALRAEGHMPTVIVAHAATPAGWPIGLGRGFQIMTDALQGEFADAPLYVDIAALAFFSRARWLKRLARMPRLRSKLVYGSDFPIPPTPWCFRRQLGRRYADIAALPSAIDRDVAIKTALLGEEVFTRGWELLRHRLPAPAIERPPRGAAATSDSGAGPQGAVAPP